MMDGKVLVIGCQCVIQCVDVRFRVIMNYAVEETKDVGK